MSAAHRSGAHLLPTRARSMQSHFRLPEGLARAQASLRPGAFAQTDVRGLPALAESNVRPHRLAGFRAVRCRLKRRRQPQAPHGRPDGPRRRIADRFSLGELRSAPAEPGLAWVRGQCRRLEAARESGFAAAPSARSRHDACPAATPARSRTRSIPSPPRHGAIRRSRRGTTSATSTCTSAAASTRAATTTAATSASSASTRTAPSGTR